MEEKFFEGPEEARLTEEELQDLIKKSELTEAAASEELEALLTLPEEEMEAPSLHEAQPSGEAEVSPQEVETPQEMEAEAAGVAEAEAAPSEEPQPVEETKAEVPQPAQAEMAPEEISPERKIFNLTTVFEIAKELGQTLEVQSLLEVILLSCMGQFGSTRAAILLLNEVKNTLNLQAIKGGGPESLELDASAFEGLGEVPSLVQNVPEPVKESLAPLEPEVVVPLYAKGKFLGIIVLGAKRTGQSYTPDDLDFLSSLAGFAAVTVENAKLYEDLNLKLKQLSALYEIAAIVNSASDLDETIKLISEVLSTGFDVSAGYMVLFTEPPHRIPIGDVKVPEDVEVPEAPQYADGVIKVPLKMGKESIGVLVVEALGDRKPAKSDLQQFSILASQVAPVIAYRSKVREGVVEDPFRPVAEFITAEAKRVEQFSLPLTLVVVEMVNLDRIAAGEGYEEAEKRALQVKRQLQELLKAGELLLRISFRKYVLIKIGEAKDEIEEKLKAVQAPVELDWYMATYPDDVVSPQLLLALVEL